MCLLLSMEPTNILYVHGHTRDPSSHEMGLGFVLKGLFIYCF